MDEDSKTISDFIDILKRRKVSLILPAVVIFAIAVAVVLVMPRTYRSMSTILIEEQAVPREFVAAAVTSYAEQRLQSVNQRIMSSARLQSFIERFNLYTDLRRK